MIIKNLKLKNYRNYANYSVEFDSGITFIHGPNGIGKTNILEAMHLIATSKSLRTKYDIDLIQEGKNFCSVIATIVKSNNQDEMELQIVRTDPYLNTSSKHAKINKVIKSVQNFVGYFNSVLFTPEDIQLITGSPSERRRYIDLVLIQIDREYKKDLSDYTKALKQRNKILEMIATESKGRDILSLWTAQLLKSGEKVQTKRENMFNTLAPIINKKADQLKAEGVEIVYKKNEISDERFWQYKHKELAAQTTLIGPHRDDFDITLNNRSLAQFGSRGQQRSAVLAIKMAEIDFMEDKTKDKPVLLLDDIFSELDHTHKEAVMQATKGQQTIITGADGMEIIKNTPCKTIELDTSTLR